MVCYRLLFLRAVLPLVHPCSFLVTDVDPLSPATLAAANSLQRLRGPDHTNHVVRHGIHMVHNLLHMTGVFRVQPLQHHGGRSVRALFNGEIYNWKELMRELRTERAHSDGDVILPLYERYGPSFARRLRGEFAIVIVDWERDVLLLVTDTFGTKPLWMGREASAASIESAKITAAAKAKARVILEGASEKTSALNGVAHTNVLAAAAAAAADAAKANATASTLAMLQAKAVSKRVELGRTFFLNLRKKRETRDAIQGLTGEIDLAKEVLAERERASRRSQNVLKQKETAAARAKDKADQGIAEATAASDQIIAAAKKKVASLTGEASNEVGAVVGPEETMPAPKGAIGRAWDRVVRTFTPALSEASLSGSGRGNPTRGRTRRRRSFGLASYASALKGLGLTDELREVPVNTVEVRRLSTLVLLGAERVFEFDLRQHKTSLDDWNAALHMSMVRRTSDLQHGVTVPLSSGIDSGVVALALGQLGVSRPRAWPSKCDPPWVPLSA